MYAPFFLRMPVLPYLSPYYRHLLSSQIPLPTNRTHTTFVYYPQVSKKLRVNNTN